MSDARKAKILLESHLSRQYVDNRYAHAKWSRNDRRDFAPLTGPVYRLPRLKYKKIQAIHIKIDILEEIIHVFFTDTLRESPDIQFRIDIQGLLGHDLDLGSAEGTHGRTRLTIEVDLIEGIEVGNVKFSDTQARQSKQVNPANPPHSGNCDAAITQRLLFRVSDPAYIP